jgi:HEPN domain-containing protein
MSDELHVARQWVAKAKNDLLSADNNLAADSVPADAVCFHCQQAAEKCLKAMLALGGIAPPRTHVLPYLADLLLATFPSVGQLNQDMAILTPYAIASRYPDDGPSDPTMEDALEARRCADTIWSWMAAQCPKLIEIGSTD